MALIPSRAPDISEGIPTPFTKRTSVPAGTDGGAGNSGGGTTTPTTPAETAPGTNFYQAADILIQDLPFRLAITNQSPYKRQSAQLNKDQLDTSKEAGEQSLSGWWLRSQTSWHKGGGISYYEPGADAGTAYRYADALGVDVWTEGQISLLHKMSKLAGPPATGTQWVSTAITASGDQAIIISSDGMRTLSPDGSTSPVLAVGTNPTKACVRGNAAWVGHAGGVAAINLAGRSVTALATQANGVSPQVFYAKSRLIVAKGRALYEIAPGGAAVNLDSATPFYTHPLTDWTWTGVSEVPSGILVSGYAPGSGAIYLIGLDTQTNAALPILGAPAELAVFPPGEQVHAIASYIGAYVMIGTNRGVRIGVFSSTAASGNSFNYGPLTVTTSSPVEDFTAQDQFGYASVTDAIDGKSGVARIDLSQEVVDNSLRFPWAWDVQTHVSGRATSVATVGSTGQVVVSIQGQGVFLESLTDLEASGYLDTGLIRFGTSEDKQFQLIRLTATTGQGQIILSSLGADGTPAPLATYGATFSPDGDLRITTPSGPRESLSFRISLFPAEPATTGPSVTAMTVKALPAPTKRQRLIQLPLECQEVEVDRYGNTVRGVGYSRLVALEALESGNAIVQVTDRRTGESFTATIEQIDYTGTQPPNKGLSRFDGTVAVTLRML